MKKLTVDFINQFQKIVMEVQESASLQDIKRFEEYAVEMRSFVAFAERVYEKQKGYLV